MSNVPTDARRQVAEVVRVEGGRILAVLARATGDLQRAEDAVQDASVSALEVWPRTGIPRNPAAWLYVAARRKAVDQARREARRADKEGEAASALTGLAGLTARLGSEPPSPSAIGDDVLRLVFTCCHPALALEARVALALRTLCGLSTAEVAQALLVTEATMAKRLVRAKLKLRAAGVRFRVPDPDELPERLAAVAAVVYLVFTAGHRAGAGEALVRTDLCDEGVRLGRLLVALLPDDPLPEALLALLLLTDARRATRVDDRGELVLLADQDRRRWDARRIAEGLDLLRRSLDRTAGVADPYQLQAAIAAQHATAPTWAATDWAEILRLYRLLDEVQPHPVVRINLAVARAEVDGPGPALLSLDAVAPTARSHPWYVARGELLARLGRTYEAEAALAQALQRAPTAAEQRHLRRRLAALRPA